MIEQFKEYIQKNKLCTPNTPILLGISGGIDSMVMLDLFLRSGYTVGIAHCNFLLRGDESDQDEFFVKERAEALNLPLFVRHFKTVEYAEKNHLSIQMAARDLRMEWFEFTRKANGYDVIALGQHLDDQTETFFINLTRGTGISGLHGILPYTGNIIRPLLFTTRDEIKIYAKKNSICYREDSSNLSDKYMRNHIRHNVIPQLEKINPGFAKTMQQNVEKIRFVEALFTDFIKEIKEKSLKQENNNIALLIEKIRPYDNKKYILFELLKDFDFTPPVCEDIASAINKPIRTGAVFNSPTHQLIVDRQKLIIEKYGKEITDKIIKVYEETMNIRAIHGVFLFKAVNITKDFVIPKSSNIACLDYEKISFPMCIKKWEYGDYFYPLGLRGRKKISDFLIDNKVPLPGKKKTYTLKMDEEVVWLVGFRIDDRFKITKESKIAYIIEYKKQ